MNTKRKVFDQVLHCKSAEVDFPPILKYINKYNSVATGNEFPPESKNNIG